MTTDEQRSKNHVVRSDDHPSMSTDRPRAEQTLDAECGKDSEDDDWDDNEFESTSAVEEMDFKASIAANANPEFRAYVVYGTALAVEICCFEALRLLRENSLISFSRTEARPSGIVSTEIGDLLLTSSSAQTRKTALEHGVSASCALHALKTEQEPDVMQELLSDAERVRQLAEDPEGLARLLELTADDDLAERLELTLREDNHVFSRKDDPCLAKLAEALASERSQTKAAVCARGVELRIVVVPNNAEPFSAVQNRLKNENPTASPPDVSTSEHSQAWSWPEDNQTAPDAVVEVDSEEAASMLCSRFEYDGIFGPAETVREFRRRFEQNETTDAQTLRQIRREALMSVISEDPRARIRRCCAELAEYDDPCLRQLLCDPSESVRIAALQNAGICPDGMSKAWFEEHVLNGSSAMKLAAMNSVLLNKEFASDMGRLVEDPDPDVSKAYAERTLEIIRSAREIFEAVDPVLDPDGIELFTAEGRDFLEMNPDAFLETYLNAEKPEWLDSDDQSKDTSRPNPEWFCFEIDDELDPEEKHYRDLQIALCLMRQQVQWLHFEDGQEYLGFAV